MTWMTDPRIERSRQSDQGQDLARSGTSAEPGTLAMLVQTTSTGAYPVAANAFYAVNPVEVDGAETEGSSPTFSVDGSRVFYAYNSGNAVPPQGSYLIACLCGGKWGFSWNS